MKICTKDISALFELALISIIFLSIIAVMTLDSLGFIFLFVFFLFVLVTSLFKIEMKHDLSVALSIPIMLSAFQNMGLGLFAKQLSNTAVQFLTILNFLYATIICCLLFLQGGGSPLKQGIQVKKIWKYFLCIFIYSGFSVVLLSHVNVFSIASSFRNIVAMFLFFFLGYLASKNVNSARLERLFLFLGIGVILIGFIEILFYKSMWLDLNITELWNKKGIRLKDSGVPTNFYSSETINGERIRRMASSFADPVNLGAFLFVVFGLAWFRKSYFLLILSVLAMILTVSKGAILGVLIFFVCYAYFYMSRAFFISACSFSAITGIGFLLYAMKTSAASVFLHISGLLAAFRGLPAHPLGHGIGSNGVLAKQFSKLSADMDVTETGLGMIISQLGIVGLISYMAFFICCGKMCSRIENVREKTLTMTFLFSIVANMFFNEVALSPNSCAAYFIIIGCYVGKNNYKEKMLCATQSSFC